MRAYCRVTFALPLCGLQGCVQTTCHGLTGPGVRSTHLIHKLCVQDPTWQDPAWQDAAWAPGAEDAGPREAAPPATSSGGTNTLWPDAYGEAPVPEGAVRIYTYGLDDGHCLQVGAVFKCAGVRCRRALCACTLTRWMTAGAGRLGTLLGCLHISC